MSPKQWTMRYGLLAGVAGGALLLAACGGGGSTATVPPTASTAPVVASPSRIATRVATAGATTAPSAAPVATVPPTVAPAPSPSAAPAGKQQRYVVQDGDTISGIAAQFGVTVQQIIDANSLQNPDLIVQGQELIIPAP
jgi:LysM repeat protein